MKLYKNEYHILVLSTSTLKIKSENTGKEISLSKAKDLTKQGRVIDCNLAFVRLEQCGFNLDEVRAFYAEDAAKRDMKPECPDCGEVGEIRGHMECQYPMAALTT